LKYQKTNTNQKKAIMNLQEFTSQAEKLGYKRISDTYTKYGQTVYGFTYEKNDNHVYHWFRESVISGEDGYMMFEHTYSTDTGRTSKRRSNQVWRLLLGE